MKIHEQAANILAGKTCDNCSLFLRSCDINHIATDVCAIDEKAEITCEFFIPIGMHEKFWRFAGRLESNRFTIKSIAIQFLKTNK